MRGKRTHAESWVELTASGLRALARKDVSGACALWVEAEKVACACGLSEPQIAAALNNAGVGHLLRSRTSDALHHFRRARHHWARVQRSLASQPMTVPAASSIFHLRLTMKHHDAFALLHRDRTVLFVRVARQIALLNRRLVRSSAQRHVAFSSLVTDLSEAFGPRCAELAILDEWIRPTACAQPDVSPYQEKLVGVARLLDSGGATGLHDEIEIAARLMVLAHPALRNTGADVGSAPRPVKGRR